MCVCACDLDDKGLCGEHDLRSSSAVDIIFVDSVAAIGGTRLLMCFDV